MLPPITLIQSVLASWNFRQNAGVDELYRLGRKLAQCRVEADLTQEKAAELAGITLRFYQDIEAGKKVPAPLELTPPALKAAIEGNQSMRVPSP